MKGPRLTGIVAGLPAIVPFVGPETQERQRGRPFRARLGANENVFAPSPAAVEAMARAAREAWMYGDPECHDLRAAIAVQHGVAPENVLVGEGIDGILGLAVRLVVGPGDPVVTSLGGYPTLNYHVAGHGGRLVQVPYRDDREDPEALVAAAREHGARLVYLANPDNPMGTWHDAGTIERMIADLPEDVLFLLDEAYVEFAPRRAVPAIDTLDPRVLRLRTFSKAHGMAGARIGYALGATDVIAAFDRIRNHFGVSRIAQAGALAALGDRAYLDRVLQDVAASRDEIARIARQNGLTPVPSATNFVAIDCGGDGDFARRVLAGLTARDIFVRMPSVAPLDRCIRISCGRAGDLELLARALPEALAEVRAATGG